jgi:ATP-dependent Lon protease
MTGEVTLRGKVLEIGGVKEKVLAAYRSGLREVLLPKSNEKDLREVPEEVRSHMVFTFVERMDEVLHLALLPRVSNELADAVQPELSPGLVGVSTPADREDVIAPSEETRSR